MWIPIEKEICLERSDISREDENAILSKKLRFAQLV